MNKLFALLLSLPIIAFAQPKLNYKIYYNDQLENEGLKVTIQTKLDKAIDSSYFHYSNEIWGENNLINCLTNLRSENTGYRFKLIPDSNRIVVYHPTSKNISFSYNIKQGFSGESIKYFSNPRVQNQYFHLLGQSLFVIPDEAIPSNVEEPIANLTIEWLGFPENFKLHNTFGTNEKKQQLKVKAWSQLFNSLFVGGDYRIYPIPYQNRIIHFATRGEWMIYNDSAFITHLKKAVFSQREFWQDNDFPYYTVIITPTITIKDTAFRSFSIKGTGLHQGFMLQSSNTPYNSWGTMKNMFNHEMMHEWIGTKIRTKNEELNYWFSEGFTDYYAYKNRLRNGDLTLDQWVSLFNKNLIEAHYKNPQKNQPNYAIKDNFWKDENYHKLPYRKGALFAFWLDNQILKRSNYTKSLDDLMREILLKSKTQNKKFTDDWFLELLEPYLHENITYFFQKHIINNTDFEFTTGDFIEGLKVDYVNSVPILSIADEKEQVLNRYLNRKL